MSKTYDDFVTDLQAAINRCQNPRKVYNLLLKACDAAAIIRQNNPDTTPREALVAGAIATMMTEREKAVSE